MQTSAFLGGAWKKHSSHLKSNDAPATSSSSAVALVESVKADESRPTENPEAKTGDGEKAQKI